MIPADAKRDWVPAATSFHPAIPFVIANAFCACVVPVKSPQAFPTMVERGTGKAGLPSVQVWGRYSGPVHPSDIGSCRVAGTRTGWWLDT